MTTPVDPVENSSSLKISTAAEAPEQKTAARGARVIRGRAGQSNVSEIIPPLPPTPPLTIGEPLTPPPAPPAGEGDDTLFAAALTPPAPPAPVPAPVSASVSAPVRAQVAESKTPAQASAEAPAAASTAARTEAAASDTASHDSEASRMGRNSLVMASGTLASRLTGQVRTILLAAAIGVTGVAADAYQVGSQIPQIFFNLLSGGLINAILVPQIVRAFQHKDFEDRINKLLTLAMTVLLGFTAVLAALTPVLVNLFVSSDWNNAQRALASAFTLWCMPQVLFYGIYTVLGQVLAARDRFGFYSWSSVAANIVACAGFGLFIYQFGSAKEQPISFWTTDKIALSAGAWTLGVAVQGLLLFIPLLQLGIHPRLRWGVRGIGLRSMGRVGIWTLGMVLLDEVFGIVSTRISTGAPIAGGDRLNIAGSQAYNQAFQIWILPYSLITVSLATTIFPILSRAVAKNDLHSAQRSLTSTLRTSGVIMVFFSAAFIAFPVPIVRALLPSVSVHDANLIAVAIYGLALNLPMASITLLLRRAFFAFEDGRSPFIVSLVMMVVEVVCLVTFTRLVPPYYWVAVVGATTIIGNGSCIPIALFLLRRHFTEPLQLGSLVLLHLKAGLAAAADGVLGWFLSRALTALLGASTAADGHLGWAQSLVVCAITGVVMLAAYIVLCKLLRIAEITSFLAVVARKVPGLSRIPGFTRLVGDYQSANSAAVANPKNV